MQTMELTTFLSWLRYNWEQGEHMTLIGETGRGKTRLASQVLECRDYAVVIAMKRSDDTLKVFHEDLLPSIKSKYTIIRNWPPMYSQNRVILWIKPESLDDMDVQKTRLKFALNSIYLSGGWTAYIDDAGYASAFLKAAQDMGIMLNQGRSGGLSVVCSITQPKSLAARIPSETLRQPRHKILFLTENRDEIRAMSDITSIEYADLIRYMHELQNYDFLYVGKRQLFHVVQGSQK